MANKQETLFEMKRTRLQNTYKHTTSRDGSLSVILDPDVAERVRRYCQTMNLNCKKVVNEIVEESIAKLEETQVDAFTPEQMRMMLKKMSAKEIADVMNRNGENE